MGEHETSELVEQLAALLYEAGAAHHEAFRETGEDPEWPLWYAEYLQDEIARLTGTTFTKSRLVYLLLSAEERRVEEGSEASWPAFFADVVVASLE